MDGEQPADPEARYGAGVQTAKVCTAVEIDEDSFGRVSSVHQIRRRPRRIGASNTYSLPTKEISKAQI